VSDSNSSASAFSAAGPALGYLAQVDYALLAALEHMNDEDDFAVSIETLDDIVFHDAETGEATAKWQSKHTIGETRSLSDASTDLWKTLANWITEPGDPKTRLVLLAVAAAGPTAALLRTGRERDVASAQERLQCTARTSSSASNAGYYATFLGLTEEQRHGLCCRLPRFSRFWNAPCERALSPSVVRRSSIGCADGGISVLSLISMPSPVGCPIA
jgi:hypothetical protein